MTDKIELEVLREHRRKQRLQKRRARTCWCWSVDGKPMIHSGFALRQRNLIKWTKEEMGDEFESFSESCKPMEVMVLPSSRELHKFLESLSHKANDL